MLVTFIPCRKNSKSIKDKNLKPLCGKPLVAWTLEIAKSCGLERIVVNTDDQRIADIAISHGVEVQMRPTSLGKDNTSMFELLRSEIFKLSPVPEHVLLLQPTSPFRNANQVNIALGYFLANLDEYDSLISVEKVPDKYHPAQVILSSGNEKRMAFGKLVSLKDKIKAFFTGTKHTEPVPGGVPLYHRLTRRQDFPEAYIPDGSIYLFKAMNLKGGTIYGLRTMLFESEGTLNINSPEDFEEAEKLCAQK